MATKGYQSYRGRMPRWKKALIAVLILILLGAGAFLALQKYQVFDADGIHLRLPGGENEPAPESAQPLPEEDLVIDVKEPEVQELHGRTFDAAALPEETFSALLDEESPVLTMKAANGTLLFGSKEDAAADMVRERIAGKHAVARISCFADTQQAGADTTMALMSVSGSTWKDPEGNAWLSPYAQSVTEYLATVAKECADLGFAEIVLDDVQFPDYGRTERIVYEQGQDSDESRIAAINAFLDAVKTAVGDEVTLSIALPSQLLEDTVNGTAGWDLSAIAQRVDRIYMDAADQTAADSARAAVSALRTDLAGEQFFVAETSQPISGGSYVTVP